MVLTSVFLRKRSVQPMWVAKCKEDTTFEKEGWKKDYSEQCGKCKRLQLAGESDRKK